MTFNVEDNVAAPVTPSVDLSVTAPVTPRPPVTFVVPATPSKDNVPTVVIDPWPVYDGLIDMILPVIDIVDPSPV